MKRNLYNHNRIKQKHKHKNSGKGKMDMPWYRQWLKDTQGGENHHWQTCGRHQQLDFFCRPMSHTEHVLAHANINEYIEDMGYINLIDDSIEMFMDGLDFGETMEHITPAEAEHYRKMVGEIIASPLSAVDIVKEYANEARVLFR